MFWLAVFWLYVTLICFLHYISAAYAVVQCLSVSPAVCHARVTNRVTISRTFSPSNAGGHGGMKKSWFLINISFYPENDTRQGHSYYGPPIQLVGDLSNGAVSIWPWVTLSDLAKYSMTLSIARPLCDNWASCLVNFSVCLFGCVRLSWPPTR